MGRHHRPESSPVSGSQVLVLSTTVEDFKIVSVVRETHKLMSCLTEPVAAFPMPAHLCDLHLLVEPEFGTKFRKGGTLTQDLIFPTIDVFGVTFLKRQWIGDETYEVTNIGDSHG